MSYLAIARKYRPALLSDIVGQEHVTRTLAHAIERDRVHHAFLFCGARGVGKTTAARALAKSLNCEQGPTPSPCGTCTSCLEIAAGTAPDLIEIDGASNNSVDDVRELRETVRYAPQRGRRKIYLVDEVHMLSTAAFNALLKTLEEPPPHVVFIFATTEPQKIPDTILSRVQRFDFKRIPVPGVVERLAEIAASEGATVSEAGLRMIARAGEGSMRDAQSLLDKVLSVGGTEVDEAQVAETLGLIDRALVLRFAEAMVRGEPDACLDLIAEVYGYGHELSVFTAELLELVRNLLLLSMSERARAHVDLAADEIEALAGLAADTEPESLTRLFDALLDVHEQVSRAARPRTVLEVATARLATTRPVVPVGQLVGRLEALERRLRQASDGGGRRPGREPPHRTGTGRVHRATPTRTGPRARSRRDRPAARPLPASASDDDRWAAFVEALGQLEPPATPLVAGFGRRQGAQLVVSVDAGRTLVAAEREAQRPDVEAALATCYGAGVTLAVEASLASRRAGVSEALEREVLADPAMRQLLDLLGGVLDDVQAPEDGGGPT